MLHVDSPLVFLGDSLTAFGHWSEHFPALPNVLNRGIPGDTTRDVIRRLKEVTRRTPRAVVLMIGTNDLIRGASVEVTYGGVREIVERMRAACPASPIVLLGVLPVREDELYEAVLFNAKACELNRRTQVLAAEHGCMHLDFHAKFADASGQLRRELTDDGVHLVPEAYALWAVELRPTLAELLGSAG